MGKILQDNQSKCTLHLTLMNRIAAFSFGFFSIAGKYFVKQGKSCNASSPETVPVGDISLKILADSAKDAAALSTPWSYDDALQRLGGDAQLLNARIGSFMRDVPLLVRDLKNSIEERDFIGVQKYAHLLKSASAAIAASALRVISKRLEFAARDHNPMAVKANFVNSERILNETVLSLKQHVWRDDSGGNEPLSHDLQDITMKLGQLRQTIEQSVFVDTATIKIFGDYSDNDTTALMAELKKSIEKLEYDKALELIRRAEKMFK